GDCRQGQIPVSGPIGEQAPAPRSRPMLEFPTMREVEKAFVPVRFQRIERQEIKKRRIVVLPLILDLRQPGGAASYPIVVKQDKGGAQRQTGCQRGPQTLRPLTKTDRDE